MNTSTLTGSADIDAGTVAVTFGNLRTTLPMSGPTKAALQIASMVKGEDWAPDQNDFEQLGLSAVDGGGFDLSDYQNRMLAVVSSGDILRIDALNGAAVAAGMESSTIVDAAGIEASLDPSLFYGIIPSIGLMTRGYTRKSQAMNALVLAISGLPTADATAVAPPQPKSIGDLLQDALQAMASETADTVDDDTVRQALLLAGIDADVKRNDEGDLVVFTA